MLRKIKKSMDCVNDYVDRLCCRFIGHEWVPEQVYPIFYFEPKTNKLRANQGVHFTCLRCGDIRNFATDVYVKVLDEDNQKR